MQKERILVVEDEVKVANFIRQGLEECGYSALIAGDINAAQQMLRVDSYELIILDVNLPDGSGINYCRRLREEGVLTPVLMLTALGTLENKLDGFESGADDYLIKPFEFRELIARVKALMKRSGTPRNDKVVLRVSNVEVDIEKRIVRRAGIKIDLTAREFALFVLLLRNPGKVFSRAEIAENIWNINFDPGTNVIDVYINFLRKKIDKGFEPKLIHTLIGQGYVIRDAEE